ncbi:hypothetical protein LTR36_003747 [Oleoguttula mirabilis]|uniref:tRNA-splicing endonuclease subunit Sen34 n=1 Tax=Oleoguttula mirabilis TaxID=1507867 RepID=A0AAV9JIX1_9PEZI|nr:hypothetical protein LTR36_003747 [Oleoguttula mirabilis]
MAIPDTAAVPEPFPIFKLAHRFLLYDTTTITYIRAKYNIAGVLIGGLPQAPQQNVFLGVPLELMPEEARLLCEKGVAYVVDDAKAHKQGFMGRGLGDEERRAFQASLRKQGLAAAGQAEKKTEDRKKAALKKKVESDDWNDIPEDMLRPTSRASNKRKGKGAKSKEEEETPVETNGESDGKVTADRSQQDDEDLLFAPATNGVPLNPTLSRAASNTSIAGGGPEPFAVTPTTSYPPLAATPPPSTFSSTELPDVPPSYPLYKHMHAKDYFLAPGLRFGCQYMAYPGDPLRFHSHFLCNGMDWDQEFDLLDLVGGGRLGTGVKKGFLIGGEVKGGSGDQDVGATSAGEGGGGNVRTFCIEWGGM